jgi:SAM-dependent methyltransferase
MVEWDLCRSVDKELSRETIMKKLIYPLMLSLPYFTLFSEGTKSPFSIETVLPLNLWGWLNESNKVILPQLLKSCEAKVAVELGSWLGAFTAFIAENLDEAGIVYAVDVWDETPECAEALNLPREELDIFFSTLYQQFLSNMIHLHLTNKVVPIRSTTLHAAELLPIEPDLIYVDASHKTADVYNDIKAWHKKLRVGGIMCGDDWGWPSVQVAVLKIAQELDQHVSYLVV